LWEEGNPIPQGQREMLSQYCSMEEGQGSKIKCFWQEEILVWDRKE